MEFQVANNELFGKYLKVLKVETINEDKNVMHLRGGFFDQQKR